MILETAFPPDLRVENEIDALLAAGHQVTIIAGFKKKVNKLSSYGKARIIRVFIPKLIYKSSIGCLSFPFYFNFWHKIIKKELLTGQYDAVHVHDLPLSQVVIKLRTQLTKNFLITLDLHENYPDMLKIAKHTNSFLGKLFFSYKQWLAYEKLMVHQVDKIITVVEEMRDRIISLGVEADKIIVVSNTFNSSKFPTPKRQIMDKDFILFYGGGVTIDRGLQYVIPSLAKIAETIPQLKLWIVGDGSYLQNLKDQAKDFRVEHLVKFYGRQPFPDLLKLLAKANIALIPHFKSPQTESGLPHKLFQYMVTGIPIVASNCSPFIRVLEDNQAGLIYKYDDIDDFSQTILKLYSNPELQKCLVNKAKLILQDEYLWEYDAKRLTKIYQADTCL